MRSVAVAVSGRTAGGCRFFGCGGYRVSGRRKHVPQCTKLVQSLPFRLAGPLIADEVVEGATVVGDLAAATRALDQRDVRRGDAAAGSRPLDRGERRPDRLARR